MDSNITFVDENYIISSTCIKNEHNYRNYGDNYLNKILSKKHFNNKKRTKKLIKFCISDTNTININKHINNKSDINILQSKFIHEPLRIANDFDFLPLKYMTKRIQTNIEQSKQILSVVSDTSLAHNQFHNKLDEQSMNDNINNSTITSIKYSMFTKFMLESTLPTNQYYNHIEYIQNISILGAEMFSNNNSNNYYYNKDVQYLVRIYFTDIGLNRLFEVVDLTTTTLTNTKLSVEEGQDINSNINEFQTKLHSYSQATFTLSTSKHAWTVCTIRITNIQLQDFYLNMYNIMQSIDEDVLYVIKDIIQLPNMDDILYRKLFEYLESIHVSNYSFIYSKHFKKYENNIPSSNDITSDDIQVLFENISQFIRNIFCLLSTFENIIHNITSTDKDNLLGIKFVLLRDKIKIILTNFLKLNNVHMIESSESYISFYKSNNDEITTISSSSRINYFQHSQTFCYHCLLLINVKLYHIINPTSSSCDYTYCYYFKAFVCNKWCYRNQKRVIPQRILYHWDIEKKSVSIQAAYLIDAIINKPIININNLNPNLIKQVPILLEVHHIKLYLASLFHKLMTLCPKKVVKLIKTYELENRSHYFVTINDNIIDIDIYSFHDLIEIHNGRLLVYLKIILHAFSEIK